MRVAVALLLAALRPTTTYLAGPAAPTRAHAPGATTRRAAAPAPSMVFGLSSQSASLFPPLFAPRREVLVEGGMEVDFELETLHLTPRSIPKQLERRWRGKIWKRRLQWPLLKSSLK